MDNAGRASIDRPHRAARRAVRTATAVRAVGAALIVVGAGLARAAPVQASTAHGWERQRCADVLATSGGRLEQEVTRRDDPAHGRVALGIRLVPGGDLATAKALVLACAFVDGNRNGQLDRGEPSKLVQRGVVFRRGQDGRRHDSFTLTLRVQDPALQRVCERSSIRLRGRDHRAVLASELSCSPIEPPPVVPEVSRAALLPASALVLLCGLMILRGRRGATGVGERRG